MHPRTEQRQSRHARPVVSLNLQQVNFNNSYSYSDGISRLNDEMNGQGIPNSPPPPYEAHDFGTMNVERVPRSHRVQPESRRQRRTANSSQPQTSASTHVSSTNVPQHGTQSHTNTSVHVAQRSHPEEDLLTRSMNQTAALCDRAAEIAVRLSDVFSTLDDTEAQFPNQDESNHLLLQRSAGTSEATSTSAKNLPASSSSSPQPPRQKRSLIDFSKTYLYANSRFPPHLPPLKLYLATYPLICAAAQASIDVYLRHPPRRNSPSSLSDSEEEYISPSLLQGTKAMTLHTRRIEVSDRRLIVLAIRGSKWNPVDWAVNFRPAPASTEGFLDDGGNAAHAGFLAVARRMVGVVAGRLRKILEGDQLPPAAVSGSATWSLLLTGHSAGGAVASLLYAHMMSATVGSELVDLAGCFRRVHCVTFGAPPVTLLPLRRPEGDAVRGRKSVFLAFANEGDPVVRADGKYVQSLVRLLAAPAPKEGRTKRRAPATWWEVPAATLSNAGKLVLLRERPGNAKKSTEAVQISDEELRVHVFGDPAMHAMELYKSRVDELAVEAITGRRHG